MTIEKSLLSRNAMTKQFGVCTLLMLLLVGCSSSENDHDLVIAAPEDQGQDQEQDRVVLQGTDLNNLGSSILSLNPDGPGGSPNQSLRSGDVLQGGAADDVLIGALGVDVLLGGDEMMS